MSDGDGDGGGDGPPGAPFGVSAAMRELAAQVDVVGGAAAPALVVGEPGVGKGWVARVLHRHGPRAGRPLVEARCGAGTDAALLASLRARAAGSTLVLDAVASLDAAAQAALLDALDAPDESGAPAARVVALTHHDLVEAVNAGTFREDLYYRLAGAPVHLPPLRARARVDVGVLLDDALAGLGARIADAPPTLDDDARERLVAHTWPGNLRELRNAIERALLAARGQARVGLAHLPAELRTAPGAEPHVPRTLAAAERAQAEHALRAHDGNRTHAARELGVSRATLIRMIQRWQESGSRE